MTCCPQEATAMVDSPELVAGKRLLDEAKDRGFGSSGWHRGGWPAAGHPRTQAEIYLAVFAAPQSCTPIRRRRSSLIVPGGLPVTARVTGYALTVLHTVVSDWLAQ
jgi:hypothetical protein